MTLSHDQLVTGIEAAEDELAGGRYRAALESYASLLRGRLATDGGAVEFGAADLIVLERLAELATLFGLFASAADLLDAMVVLCRRADNTLASDYAQLKRIELAFARGRIHQSYDLLRELEPRLGKLEDIDLSADGLERWERTIGWQQYPAEDRVVLLTRAYLVMGQLLASNGKYIEAREVLRRGLTHARERTAPDLARRTAGAIRLAHAAALLEFGDVDAAGAALSSDAEQTPDDLAPAAYTRRLELSGKLDMLRGRLGPAVRSFEAVIEFCGSRGFLRARAGAMLNLGHVLVLLNRVGDALALADEARRNAEELCDPGLALRAAAIGSLALARRRSPATAVAVALSVREMIRGRRPGGDEAQPPSISKPPPSLLQNENFLAFFEDRALEFHWALAADSDDARCRLEAIRDTFAGTESRLITARLVVLEGLLALACGDLRVAASYFERAERRLTEMSLRPELWQVLHLRARCLNQLGLDDEAAQLVETAEELLSGIAGTLEGDDRTVFLLNKATVEEEYIGSQVDALLREQRHLGRSSYFRRWLGQIRTMRRLHGLMEHIDAYKADLVVRHFDIDDASSRQAPPRKRSVSFLRRLVGTQRDRAHVSFLVLPDRVFVVWSGFLTLGFAVSPVTRLELRERVRSWHELMRNPQTGSRRDIGVEEDLSVKTDGPTGDKLIERLGEALQVDRFIAALPKRVRSLSIMPDDVLHGVPFAALRHRGGYLVERFALSISFTTRSSRRSRRVDGMPALVVGVSRGSGRLVELPQVLVESRSVATWLTERGLKVQTLIDDDATCAAVIDGLRDAAVVHIACHGTFEPRQPDQSGLELIPANGQIERLTLRALAGILLSQCQHITLSSCWSADNFIVPGRWIISLPETLWRSGAGGVLGSLWAADDDVAAAFTERFYAELERMPRDVALRKVQLACIANQLGCRRAGSALIDTSTPEFWAGFVLYGDTARLKM